MKPLDPLRAPLDGFALIEASAGTGKTYAIAMLFLRLLLERGLEVGQILVVTYTRAATAELRDRIRRRLLDASAALDAGGSDDEALERLFAARRDKRREDRRAISMALRDFDAAAIFTIHGFCQRALTEHAFESRTPFELEPAEQERPLVQQIAEDYWTRETHAAEGALVAALDRKRVSPESLEALATQALRNPDLPLLPERESLAAVPSAERFAAARDRAAELFRAERAPILYLLCDAERLHRAQYKAETIRRDWAHALDQLASIGLGDLPAWLAKLTPEALASATKKNKLTPEHEFFTRVGEMIDAAIVCNQALDQQVLGLRRRVFAYARREAALRKQQRGAVSFDDLLHRLGGALAREAGDELAANLARRFPAALIDEFQDTDPVQYGIFRRVYAARPGAVGLFLIGDPKQAIYGFRSADVFAYLNAARDAGAARYTLDVNRRSDPRLLRGLNTLFGRAVRPFVIDDIRFEPVRSAPGAREHLSGEGPALQFLLAPRMDSAHAEEGTPKPVGALSFKDAIASEIVALLRSGETLDGAPLEPRHVAVLTRTNRQARLLQAALSKLRVPTVLDSDSSVFEAEMAEELARVLWAVAQPANLRRQPAALASSMLGLGAAELHRMRNEEAGAEAWLERFARLNQLWHERGFIRMFHQLLDETGVQARLLARSDGERRLTDLLHLSELLHQAALSQHLGPLALLAWFGRMRGDPAARTSVAIESMQIRLEHDEYALKLTTVHRSKGLEYPIVFIPYTSLTRKASESDALFHDPDDGHRLKLDLGSPESAEHARLAARETEAENMRVLYVAMTRARHRCYVAAGSSDFDPTAPLGRLVRPATDHPLSAQAAKRFDPDDLRAMLGALSDAAEGAIGVRELTSARSPSYEPREPEREALVARRFTRVIPSAPRSSSFSRLTKTALGSSSDAATEQGLDLDDDTAAPALFAETPVFERVLLHDFPQGSRPGTLIHSLYERIDFASDGPAQLEAAARDLLSQHGLDAAHHASTLARAIELSLETPLDAADPPLRLRDVRRAARLDELEFTLDARHAPARLSADALARVFASHGAPAAAPDYAARLRELSSLVAPRGFLKGFIDLVFAHGERFYIVDYKSNWLGTSALDYAPPRLVQAMSEHHYFLQYHLYALALDRHLRLRVPGYEYARHFGGVYYLFMRGMAPEHPRGTGVFFDRPSHGLIEALARALGADGVKP